MASLALDIPQTRQGFPSFLKIIALALALAAISYGTHAVLRHGGEAQAVRECLQHNGPVERWENFTNGHQALLCQLPDGRWGIQIVKNRREITSFIKNKVSRVEQLYQYLNNRGYQYIKPH